MDNIKVVAVSGFAFENPDIGEEALKEQEAIEYVNKQLNFSDTNALLTLYNQMVARRMFHTEVGYYYLKSIQDHLMKQDIDPAMIESIPVLVDKSDDSLDTTKDKQSYENANSKVNNDSNEGYSFDEAKYRKKERKLIAKAKKYQKLTITFITITIVLVATVVAMFVVAMTSDNPTILNYEEVLQNKYASWEQDLEAREAALKKQEKALK